MSETREAVGWTVAGVLLALLIVVVVVSTNSSHADRKLCQASGGKMIGRTCFASDAVIFR